MHHGAWTTCQAGESARDAGADDRGDVASVPESSATLRRYVSMLSRDLSRAGDTVEKPPLIIPILLYDGLPEWTPRSFGEEWTSFGFKFVDMRRNGWPGSTQDCRHHGRRRDRASERRK